MKTCPLCSSTYEDWIDFCFNDGSPLVVGADAATPPARALAPAPGPPPPPVPPEATGGPNDVTAVLPIDPSAALDAPEPQFLRARAAPPPKPPPPPPIARPAREISQALTPVPDASDLPGSDAPPPPPPPPPEPELERAARPIPVERPARSLGTDAPGSGTADAPGAGAEPDTEPGKRPGLDVDDPEAGKATVPMYAPQPGDDPFAEDTGKRKPPAGKRAPAPGGGGAFLGIAGVLGLGVLVLVVLSAGWYMMKRSASGPTEVAAVAAPPAPPPAQQSPPPPEPEPVAEEVAPPEEARAAEVPVEPAPAPAVASVAPAPSAPAVPPSGPTARPGPAGAPTATPTSRPAPAGSTPSARPGVPAPTPTERPADPAAQTPVVAAPGASSPSTTSDSVWGAPAMDTRGSLRITTDPPGAQVFVNDDPRGRAPVTVELPYGKHRVRAVQSSYRTEVADVNLNVREMSVPLRLQPELKQGQVSIFGPAGSNVYVDSHDAGPVPVTVFAAEGVRTFRLKQSDGKECTTTQEVRFAAAGKAVLVNLAPCP